MIEICEWKQQLFTTTWITVQLILVPLSVFYPAFRLFVPAVRSAVIWEFTVHTHYCTHTQGIRVSAMYSNSKQPHILTLMDVPTQTFADSCCIDVHTFLSSQKTLTHTHCSVHTDIADNWPTPLHLHWPSLLPFSFTPAFGILSFSPVFHISLSLYPSICILSQHLQQHNVCVCVWVCAHRCVADRLIKPFSAVSFTTSSEHLNIPPRHWHSHPASCLWLVSHLPKLFIFIGISVYRTSVNCICIEGGSRSCFFDPAFFFLLSNHWAQYGFHIRAGEVGKRSDLSVFGLTKKPIVLSLSLWKKSAEHEALAVIQLLQGISPGFCFAICFISYRNAVACMKLLLSQRKAVCINFLCSFSTL